MKLMFFGLSLRGGGAERVLATISNELAKSNDVSIMTVHNDVDYYEIDEEIKRICIDRKKYDDNAGVLNKLKKVSLLRVKKIINNVVDEKPDVIITFLPLPSIYITMARMFSRSMRKVPIILSERGDPYKEYRNKVVSFLTRRLYRKVDGFVFQTVDAQEYFKRFVSCRTAIIENPINKEFMGRENPKVRKKKIVSCGRLEPQKNFKLLIRSFSLISLEHPEYDLWIYGEGSQRDELLGFARELGVEKNVLLRGRVNNLADEISDAGVFVLSSDYEGMPNALMEAMALGIPCISTDCPVGGPRSLIRDGQNGILVKVDDVNELANAMRNVIFDEKCSDRLSMGAYESAKKYSVDKVADKWKNFIEQVVSAQ